MSSLPTDFTPLRLQPTLDTEGLQIAIVTSRFNADITARLEEFCLAELAELGVDDQNIVCVQVPGALELPLVLDQLAESGRFDALIALGAVIRGETYHFEVVSNASAEGIARVALNQQIPIANGVLTTDTEEQALARVEEKARDCARLAVEMACLLIDLDDVLSDDDEDEEEDV